MATIFCPCCEGFGERLRCPRCGHTDSVRGFDAGGADPGNYFCVQCHHEAPMDDVPCPGCGGQCVVGPDVVVAQ